MTDRAALYRKITYLGVAGFYLRRGMVVTLVAGITGIKINVAGFANQIFSRAVIQREDMLGQMGRTPGRRNMAAGAICAKLPGMDIRLLMAPRTVARRAGVGLVGMAIAARSLRVPAIQQIDLVVIKIGHPVPAIMTFCAPGTVFFHVDGGKIVIGLGMTGEAIEGFADVIVLVVATFAGEGGVLIINLMMGQAKTGEHFVVNIGKGKRGHSHFTAPVFFVAILAAAGRQPPVQPASFGALLGHVHMAILATVLGNTMDRRMTVGAFLFKLCVRSKSAQHLIVSRHRRHRAGQHPAALVHVNGRAKSKHAQRNYQAGKG